VRHLIKKSRGSQVKYHLLLLSHFNVTLCQRFIEQYSNINQHGILSGESSTVPRGQMDVRTGGETQRS